ncbi:hypothetical protein BD413DRAFT_517383 [Trametes elegans]|nr:hypothetical protein BD413DRAFT_517383 [Trametes elegans]
MRIHPLSSCAHTMPLFVLPDELLVQIAAQLDFEDLYVLQKVSSRWYDIIRSNAALQYAIELHVAGMIDNPASRLVPGDRLRILQNKEEAWRTLDLSDKRSLPLSHNPSGIYDLTGGVLLLGERRHGEGFSGTDSVHTVKLHSVFSESNSSTRRSLWSNLDLGEQVIDVGLAIQEHDLIAIVTYTYVQEAQLLASVDIHLLQHSTGQPHPAAAKPVIHFENIHYLPGHCSIMLEISGDTLCFLLNNYFPFINADPVTLTVYNWKTGQPKAKRLYSDTTTFNSFILLSPDTVAIPIIPTNALEICQFADALAAPPPPSGSEKSSTSSSVAEVPTLKTTCVLELPTLHPGALVLRMTCRCEPNPRGHPSSATFASTTAPYFSNPERAVMILHLHLRLPIGITRVYTMIAHRSSLVRAARAALGQHENPKAASPTPTEPSEELLNEYFNLDEDEYEEVNNGNAHGDLSSLLGAYHQEPSAHGAPTRRRRRSAWRTGVNADSDDESADSDEPVRVLWADWGPPATRWFQDELAGTRWITTTCGQRFVRVRADGRLRVYDFNALALRRYGHARALAGVPVGARPGEDVLEEQYYEWSSKMDEDEDEDEDDGVDAEVGNGEAGDREWHPDGRMSDPDSWRMSRPEKPERRLKLVLGTTMIADPTAWEKTLESSLPYMETSVPAPDDYESVLLDEDIIIGLKMDTNGRHIREVVLHRIGGGLA